MDHSNKNKNSPHQHAQVKEAAAELYQDSQKLAHELYDEGLSKLEEAQGQFKEQSEELLQKVKDNPLASILIAGGIGFILSSLLRK